MGKGKREELIAQHHNTTKRHASKLEFDITNPRFLSSDSWSTFHYFHFAHLCINTKTKKTVKWFQWGICENDRRFRSYSSCWHIAFGQIKLRVFPKFAADGFRLTNTRSAAAGMLILVGLASFTGTHAKAPCGATYQRTPIRAHASPQIV